MTPLDLMTDRRLFGRECGTKVWAAWRVFVAALFAVLTRDQLPLYQRCTGRTIAPTSPAREAHVIVGRRGGKSRMAALLAVYLACFKTYRLAPGERGVVMVIAADRRQARVVFRYVLALLNAVPMLAALITRQTRDSLDLSNGISIEIHTASFRVIRGYTVVGAICDEIAFWPTDDAADPDTEILNALRPAMATIPDALLLTISSPYARRGELYTAHVKHFGQDGDPILVWQADTRTMNPTVPESVITKAYEDDPASAAAEYGGLFRSDVESFINREVIDVATVPGRFEMPYVSACTYAAFVDPSGGRADSFTLAIAHREQDRAVLDVIRETRPPFSPEQVIAEYAAVLHAYGLTRCTSDRYGGEFPVEQFRKHGITVEPSDKAKSDIYGDALPLLNSRRVDLLDHPRLRSQLASLERRTARGGRDSIDHAPNQHDDVANSACGALVLVGVHTRQPIALFPNPDEDDDVAWQRRNSDFLHSLQGRSTYGMGNDD